MRVATAMVLPLCEFASSDDRDLRALVDAWERLGNTRGHSPTVLADLLLVLSRTIPEDISPAPRAVVERASPRPRRSAAHPRGFRGTTYQPPKPAQPAEVDLRPALSDLNATNALLASLWNERHAALEQLVALGQEHEHWRGCLDSPTPSKPLTSLPRSLRQREFFSLVRNEDGALQARVEGTLRYLSASPEGDALVAWLLAGGNVSAIVAWLELLVDFADAQRIEILEIATRTGSVDRVPAPSLRAAMLEVIGCVAAENVLQVLWELLESVNAGCEPEQILDGIRLAARSNHPQSSVRISTRSEAYDSGLVNEALAAASSTWHSQWATAFWRLVSEVTEIQRWLASRPWRELSPEQAAALYRILWNVRYEDTERSEQNRLLASFLHETPKLIELLRSLPSTRMDTFIDWTVSCVLQWRTPEELRGTFVSALEWFTRVQATLPEKELLPDSLAHFACLGDPTLRTQAFTASHRSVSAVFAASARRNDASLVYRGIRALLERVPQQTVDWFCRFPAKLCRTAKTIGVSTPQFRRHLMAEVFRHPLLTPDVTSLSTEQLATLIAEDPSARIINPVSRALRKHIEGHRTLRPNQLLHHDRVLRERLGLLQLQVIENGALVVMAKGTGLDTAESSQRHAALVLRDMVEGKRGLRTFLRAYAEGRTDYLEQHPATLAWIRRHPRIRLDVWRQGLAREVDVHGRRYRLNIEQDPLEILKLGTYAGTCFGIGGIYSESPATVLLDINKCVVFARDERQRVVARQILAISDDDRLIAFSVYPETPRLEDAFRVYDADFAHALSIPLGPQKDEGYDISFVLGRSWWDDGAWIRSSEEPAA